MDQFKKSLYDAGGLRASIVGFQPIGTILGCKAYIYLRHTRDISLYLVTQSNRVVYHEYPNMLAMLADMAGWE